MKRRKSFDAVEYFSVRHQQIRPLDTNSDLVWSVGIEVPQRE